MLELYKAAVAHTPVKHQRQAWEKLSQGQPVVLRAPTGTGKTEAVVLPFICFAGNTLPNRLLYALPLRALANQLVQRISGYAQKLGKPANWRVCLQHGEAPESVLFTANVVIATIDQVITSYACAPLTLPLRHGNIPAGAVTGSFLVFDEIHIFDPELALQATRLICERLYHLGIPYAVLSATLPDSVVEFWNKNLGADLIEAKDEFVRRSVEVILETQPLGPKEILQALNKKPKRVLVVCNTVDRAMALFEAVRSQVRKRGYECELLHSRFLPEDRQRKEAWVTARFGKEAPTETKALLVATQVVEVGLNISCDCLLTELAPIDALIQRAGRCARWGGDGIVRVFKVERASPYDKDLVKRTKSLLQDGKSYLLTWERAKNWVNWVLNDRYRTILEGDKAYEWVVAQLSQAAFEGSRSRAEAAVRDVSTVEVSVHNDPEALGTDALRLPTISLHLGIAKRWLKQAGKAWRLEVDSAWVSDAHASVRLMSVSESDITIGDRLIFPASFLNYSHELGLRRGQGEEFAPRLEVARPKLASRLQRETWVGHAYKVFKSIEEIITEEKHAVEGLAILLEAEPMQVHLAAKLAALFHDLGKLSIEWQQKAGIRPNASPDELLAHIDGHDYINFPPHATVSAYALWPVLVDNDVVPRILGRAVAFAIAHHHSVRAKVVPEYQLHPAWEYAVETALEKSFLNLNLPLDRVVIYQPSQSDLRGQLPPMECEQLYTAYVLVSRWLRLADRIATGGEDAILRYENWFGGL